MPITCTPAERVEGRGKPLVRVGQRRAEVHEQVAAHPEIVGAEGHGGQALEEAGLRIVERISIEVESTEKAARYLRTKKEKLGHLLNLSQPSLKST